MVCITYDTAHILLRRALRRASMGGETAWRERIFDPAGARFCAAFPNLQFSRSPSLQFFSSCIDCRC